MIWDIPRILYFLFCERYWRCVLEWKWKYDLLYINHPPPTFLIMFSPFYILFVATQPPNSLLDDAISFWHKLRLYLACCDWWAQVINLLIYVQRENRKVTRVTLFVESLQTYFSLESLPIAKCWSAIRKSIPATILGSASGVGLQRFLDLLLELDALDSV